ncbi:MAG: protoporphyrinogen oxidase HemJ [Pseudomonadota bacterium]
MYEWVLAAHIISFIAWMAGILYLPRLFVYHANAEVGGEQSETFKVMERRLLKAIMTPAMLATWVFGLWLMVLGQHYLSGWFHAKLVLVIGISVFHMMCARWVKTFAADENQKSHTFFRIANEIPTLMMIAVVILVIVKPF